MFASNPSQGHAPVPTAHPVLVPDAALQSLVDAAARSTLGAFASQKLLPEQLAITVVDLREPDRLRSASHRGAARIYPASVVKLFYLAAAHQWLEEGRLADTPELQRALRDMIVDSSNDATAYVVDLLTGTTSGPELPDAEIAAWFDRREAVNRHFAALGYTGVNANKKPWGDGPYGRETQATRLFEPKRNALTTDDTARLLSAIATGRCVSRTRSDAMLALLARDPATRAADPDDQARFTGPALPPGSRLWSKAGWTSQTRHDAALVELPDGAGRLILVVFTTDHAREKGILHAAARAILSGWPKTVGSP